MKNKFKEINNNEVNEVVSLTKKILKLLYVVMVVAIVLCGTIILKNLNVWHLLFTFLKVLSPLFIGFIIAWLLDPIVKKMHKNGIPRIIGSLLVYAIFLIFIYIFLRIFIPSFADDFVTQVSISGLDLNTIKDNLFNSIGDYLVSFTNSLPTFLMSILGNLVSGLGTILISLVVGLYMLFDFDAISKHFLRLVPAKNRYEIEILLLDIGKEVRKTISGTLLVALMVFICDTIGFAIIGLKAPLLFGMFCGLTDLIPYIGFSQGSITGIAVLIICVIVQLVENYILQPVIMSKTTQLHPVTIIVGLLVFGHYFGIVGMIIATPCIALLKVIFKFIVKKYDLFKDDEVLLQEVLKDN